VHAADRWWYGNCAWDALGICAALRADGRIEASCPDCGDHIAIEVRDERVDDESLLFNCLVPASAWLGRHHLHLKHDESLRVGGAHPAVAQRARGGSDDPGREAERACARVVEGQAVPGVGTSFPRANQGILDQLGLTGEFWRLP
jgi:hypothetical protein